MESNAGLSQWHKLCAVRQDALTSSKAMYIYQVGNFEILNKKNMRYTVSIKRNSISTISIVNCFIMIYIYICDILRIFGRCPAPRLAKRSRRWRCLHCRNSACASRAPTWQTLRAWGRCSVPSRCRSHCALSSSGFPICRAQLSQRQKENFTF